MMMIVVPSLCDVSRALFDQWKLNTRWPPTISSQTKPTDFDCESIAIYYYYWVRKLIPVGGTL